MTQPLQISARLIKHPEECPRAELHEPAPNGYLEWHEWAAEKAKTHKQARCPGCNLYHVWVER